MPPITIDFADTRSILAALGSTEGGSHLPEIAAVHAAAQKAGDCSLAHMQRAQLLRELAESRAEVAALREQLRLLEHTAKYQDYLLLHRAGDHTAAPPVDEEAVVLARAGVFVTPGAVCPVCQKWPGSSGTCPGVLVLASMGHRTGVPRGPLSTPELARLRIGIWVHDGRGEMALALNSEPCDCQEARSPDGDLYTHARDGAPRCPCGWTFVRVLSDWVHAPASGNGRWRSIPLASLDGAAPAAPPSTSRAAQVTPWSVCTVCHRFAPFEVVGMQCMAISGMCLGRFAQAVFVRPANDERFNPRTLRSATEGAAAAVRAAMGEVIKSETSLCEERCAALLSEALLLLADPPPRFDFGQALFARLIKSYEGTMVRPGVYRLDLSLGNLRSAISIVEGDERAAWTRAVEREQARAGS